MWKGKGKKEKEGKKTLVMSKGQMLIAAYFLNELYDAQISHAKWPLKNKHSSYYFPA